MLTIIVSTLFLSLLTNIILKKFSLPTIIGYIATGTIIAYAFGLHDAVNNHDLKEIAEFGVVFLMFTIGLEFSLEHLKRMKNEVFVTGSLQIGLTALFVYLISYYALGIGQNTSIIIALALSLSSTAIILKTFNDTGEINRRYGRRALGILIMQDIAVIPILLTIGFLSSPDKELGDVLIHMAISATVLLGLLWFIGKYLLERFFAQIIKTNSDELFVGSILFLAIGSSYLAYSLGFSYSLGAFIAGMLIAETKFKHQAEADLIPFRDILLGIFFITVGMQIKFDIISQYLHIIILLLIAIMTLKFVIIFLLVKMNESKRVSLKTALSLVQLGEFSLAILELARANSIVEAPHGQVLIITIVISMVLTPVILKNLSKIADTLLREKVVIPKEQDPMSQDTQNHVVIIGFGEFGQKIALDLEANGTDYIAVENSLETYNNTLKKGLPVIFGNATNKEILKKTRVMSAKNIVVAIDNPHKLYHICQILQRYTKKDNIIVKIHNEKENELLSDLGITNVIVENKITSKEVVNIITTTIS